METIEINGQKYEMDVEKLRELGILKKQEPESKSYKPHSWEEHSKNHEQDNMYCAGALDDMDIHQSYDEFKTREIAEAFNALGKLIQLRDEWLDGWEPNWEDVSEKKYCIEFFNGIAQYTQCLSSTHRILVFPTEGMRNEFGETFHDLIEQAKMFL